MTMFSSTESFSEVDRNVLVVWNSLLFRDLNKPRVEISTSTFQRAEPVRPTSRSRPNIPDTITYQMDPGVESRRPKIRLRRSNTTLDRPSIPPSPIVEPQDAKKSLRHHHSHSHSHHHLSHHPRLHAKDAQPLRDQNGAFWDLSKQSTRTAQSGSPGNGSRGVSPAGVEGGRKLSGAAPGTIKSEDITRERHRGRIRDKELRASLQSLSEQSMKTTRQLDDVFYSILEKVSVLQSTISNLQELSMLTGNLHREFQTEAGGLESEIREQIAAFGGFHDPQQRIGNLEARVKTSKEKADELSARLEAARARVQKLEAEEAEYQATISRRLRMIWIILGSVCALVIALWLFHALKQPSNHVTFPSNHSEQTPTLSSTTIPSVVKEVSHVVFDNHPSPTSHNATEPPASSSRPHLEDDPRLRIFDEL